MAAPAGYSRVQIALHWLTAVGVLVAWFTHDAMEDIAKAAWEAGQEPFPTVHSVAGISVFFLVVIRLVLRARRGAPDPEAEGAMRTAAIWGHRALYLLLLGVPLGGFLTWIVGFHDLGEVHGLAGQALLLLALGHAVVALWHHYGLKDGTLRRMMRPE